MGATDSYGMIPFNDEHTMLREMVRKYADEQVAPRAFELDDKHMFPHKAVQELAELDLLGIYIPEEYGGAGMDFVSYVITMEELARVCGSTAITLAAHTSLCMAPIMYLGNHEQKAKYLPPLAKGEDLGCFGLSEPEAGSDAGNCQTTAVLDGEQGVLRGTSRYAGRSQHCGQERRQGHLGRR